MELDHEKLDVESNQVREEGVVYGNVNEYVHVCVHGEDFVIRACYLP